MFDEYTNTGLQMDRILTAVFASPKPDDESALDEYDKPFGDNFDDEDDDDGDYEDQWIWL